MSTILSIAFKFRLLRWPACLAVAWVIGSASGCSTVGQVTNVVASSTANFFSGPPAPSFLDWKAITLVAAQDVNQNSPLALDLVFVRDFAALEKLLTMPAAKWFSSKEELLKTYPNALSIKSWELVPQQVLQLSEEELGSPRVAGMVLFADYFTPGDHRAQLPMGRWAFLVDLSARSFSVKTKPR